MTPPTRSGAPFELLAFTATPVGDALVVLAIDGHFPRQTGRFTRQPLLVVEPGEDRARLELAPVRSVLDGGRWHGTYALPVEALTADARLALGLRGTLLELPAPDERDDGQRLTAVAREANALRRALEIAQATAAARATEAEAERAAVEGRVEGATAAAVARAEEAEAERAALQERLAAAKAERGAVEERLDRAEAERAALATRLEEAEAEPAALAERLAVAEQDLQIAQQERAALEERLQIAEAERAALGERLAAAERELQIAQDERVALEERLAAAEQHLQIAQDERVALEERLAAAEAAAAADAPPPPEDLDAPLTAEMAAAIDADARLAAADREIESLRQRLAAAEAGTEVLRAELVEERERAAAIVPDDDPDETRPFSVAETRDADEDATQPITADVPAHPSDGDDDDPATVLARPPRPAAATATGADPDAPPYVRHGPNLSRWVAVAALLLFAFVLLGLLLGFLA